jgi:hypothetical protein
MSSFSIRSPLGNQYEEKDDKVPLGCQEERPPHIGATRTETQIPPNDVIDAEAVDVIEDVMVSQTLASWNRMDRFVRQIEALRRAATH